jgi:hypothetical protein
MPIHRPLTPVPGSINQEMLLGNSKNHNDIPLINDSGLLGGYSIPDEVVESEFHQSSN